MSSPKPSSGNGSNARWRPPPRAPCPRPRAPTWAPRRPGGRRGNVAPEHDRLRAHTEGAMAARLKAPGMVRGGVMFLGGIVFAFFLTWVIRASTGHTTFHHYISGDAIVTVALMAAPLGFLAGLGGFDYWFYWASGRRTRPEDHSGHGAYSWRDY